MARSFISLTRTSVKDHDGRYLFNPGGGASPVTTLDTATYDTDQATMITDMAVLVADGASPTQAHVNTVNSDFTTLQTDYTALKAQITAVAAETGDVYLSIDTSKIVTLNDLKAALDNLLRMAQATNLVT